MTERARWGGKNHRGVRGGPRTTPKALRGQDRPLKGTLGWPTLGDGTQVIQEALPLPVYWAMGDLHGGLQSVCWEDDHWAGWVKFPTSLSLVSVRLNNLQAVADG